MKGLKLNMRVGGLIVALIGAFLILKWRWPGVTVAVIGFYIMHVGTQREKQQERKNDDEIREKIRRKRLVDKNRGQADKPGSGQ